MTKELKRRTFSDLFKLEVLSEYYSEGVSQLSITRKYGLTNGALLSWIKKWPVDSKVLSLPSEIISSYQMAHPKKKSPQKKHFINGYRIWKNLLNMSDFVILLIRN